ncbi:hypothetical protein CRUP_018321 [Coryphaenoides rupestris]|nr:hypothetical protein CRUP_018321 [Coryphaenoides rupestris]
MNKKRNKNLSSLQQDSSGARVPVPQDEGPCGVRQSKEDSGGGVSFYSRYNSCYTHIQGSSIVVPLAVQLAGDDRWLGVNISCPLTKRQPQATHSLFPGQCDIVPALRVPCGHPLVSMETCGGLGCCFDAQDAACYYILNIKFLEIGLEMVCVDHSLFRLKTRVKT